MFIFLIFYLGKGVKVLRLQALPTQNLPQKSHEVAAKPERRHLQIVKEIPQPNSNTKRTKNVYISLRDMENKISKQKMSGFQLQSTERKIILRKMMSPYTIPYFEIIIDESLEFTCYILGWKVPDVHTLYRTFIRSARKSTITEDIALLSSFKLCMDCHQPQMTHFTMLHLVNILKKMMNPAHLRYTSDQKLANY